jgi:hypothetical protein
VGDTRTRGKSERVGPVETPAPGTPPPSTPQPPPAAVVVTEGKHKEGDASELVRLRQEASDLAAKLKAREMEISQVQDENHRIKAIPQGPPARKGFNLREWFPPAD